MSQADTETKEGLVHEYCDAVRQKKKAGNYCSWGDVGITQARITYIRMRIPMLLESTDDHIWAAEEYRKVHPTNSTSYQPFLVIAVRDCKNRRQLNRLVKIVPAGPLKEQLLEKGIELSKDKKELVDFIRKYLK